MKHDFKCNPEMEIAGQTVMAYLDNVRVDIIQPIFRKYNIYDPKPENWYPLQPILDVLKELHEGKERTSNLVAVGVKTAEYGVEPEDIEAAPLPVVLEHWNDHLQMNFRNGDPGVVITEKVHDKFYKLTQINMFPDDLCYGLAYGFARSRLPLGTNFRVWYEEFNNRIDNGGGDKTVICIEWE